jgi:hypothetical protein
MRSRRLRLHGINLVQVPECLVEGELDLVFDATRHRDIEAVEHRHALKALVTDGERGTVLPRHGIAEVTMRQNTRQRRKSDEHDDGPADPLQRPRDVLETGVLVNGTLLAFGFTHEDIEVRQE